MSNPPGHSGILVRSEEVQNATGREAFASLARYALACLSMPPSNAAVDRIFSTVTVTKTKLKNKMEMPMLHALLRIKTDLCFQKKCCNSFEVTPRMLELFNSKGMYGGKNKEAAGVLNLCPGNRVRGRDQQHL